MNNIIQKITENIETVIKGKHRIIELALIPLITEGHLIFQDIPGVGKSTLAEAVARSINGSFKRMQFTSDLLPSDIIGVNVFDKLNGHFSFKKGPIFANIVLADEINRASPKTQSALLEAMNEKTITVDGTTYRLPNPFLIIATENPVEFSGTYPLPESELDRFMMSLSIGYPDTEVEKEIVRSGEKHKVSRLMPVVTANDILFITTLVKKVFVKDNILNYAMRIIKNTRNNDLIKIGISVRGSMDFIRAIKGYAFMEGREYAVPDDVKSVAPFVLSHRITLKGSEKNFGREIINEILEKVEVPI
ncbi:MAG: AAA domain-containing protein [Nitrospiraceae bacterium]|nr:AAA domain-containing protein [Nitrospiraceae bacterium]